MECKGEAAFTAPTHSRASAAPASQEAQELQALRNSNKVAELERLIGQQTVELSSLKKLSQIVSSAPSNNGVK